MHVQAVRLVAGRADERVAGPEDRRHVVAEAEERDRVAQAGRVALPTLKRGPRADDDEPGVPGGFARQTPPGAEEGIEPLAAVAQCPDERERGPGVADGPAEPRRASARPSGVGGRNASGSLP